MPFLRQNAIQKTAEMEKYFIKKNTLNFMNFSFLNVQNNRLIKFQIIYFQIFVFNFDFTCNVLNVLDIYK
jgi:hypothetical protein